MVLGESMLPPEKQEEFVRMWVSGATIKEIASTLGIRVNMVSPYARVLGLPKRRQPPASRKIGDEDLEAMKIMWLEGATIKKIAEHFGVNTRTVVHYLHAMGLKRRGNYRRCPDIPHEELEKLCWEGRSDKEIAEMYNTSTPCIVKLRKEYGINRRELIKKQKMEKRLKAVETIIGVLKEKGYTTSLELREKYGIKITRELLRKLEGSVDGLRWFIIIYTSTLKYSVFPAKFNYLAIIYLQGEERKVLEFLLSNLIDPNVPRSSIKRLLRYNCAPEELIELLH